ncbi:MAG: hypothetical protein P0Y49_12205 [Candidatus Pedobacter colombiensis]|uniref:Uncharacterized protein n=1 Tax=Candidatus Pedobacter colombiensis TaxID=3121371 RepID=A0AAJ5W309_9SPHI|nr:hypothetical protein [Pedobacter sp.]WEK17558.1 MAG: hypothetical protein P0Y49_12205 [Pedobacter sp.]
MNEISRLIFEQLTEAEYRNNELEIDNLSAFEEPPFWEKVRALFRRYKGIDQPKNIEEAQERDEMNRRYTVLSENIKRIHHNHIIIFGFVPGYSALDALVAEQNYTSSAVNLSIDLFGGSLLKGITGPIFRVGEKYLFSITELALKYPNIANKLGSFNIREFNIIKRSSSNKIIYVKGPFYGMERSFIYFK